MLNALLTKVVGSKNERTLKRLRPVIEQINALEPKVQALSDQALRDKRAEFKSRLDQGEGLDALLPEAFAVVREAGKRVLGMRHFDVQLIGGMVLHEGKIAEMKTGEGKTLVATLPSYLNALTGKGVHVVTVNDYLARRDAEWMGRLHRFLGMAVGVIQHDLNDRERQEAYQSDITYGTNNELGFDYLRDNMKFSIASMVQRGHHFAIVDEVDSILIDEARTPLIISGPSEEATDKYYKIDKIIPRLEKGAVIQGGKEYELDQSGDFIVDEKARTVTLTEHGVERCQELLGIENLYDPAYMDVLHHVSQALKAHVLFKRDVDYMIKDGEVVIVDEFTGRLMPGRRWSDGLHQAVEAKEGVKIERENQTLATITFQNYFRMYDKLSGMTGTADTEAVEFDKIYELEVVVIPPNRPMVRKDHHDLVYRTDEEKWKAVVDEIAKVNESGQPTLVGTVSIEKSERVSTLLKRRGIKHVVLNAKYHEMEAEIVAQAGRVGQVTIATNMAGRGTDILLGGNPEFLAKQELTVKGMKVADTAPEAWQAAFDEALSRMRGQTQAEHDKVVSLGGLHILGTERHESRRIDNQLRGRAGRQGDPGTSRFYLSLDDDLMRIFGGDRMKNLMKRLGMEEGVPIEERMVTRAIERAQKQVEQRNFETRKHLLEYDDVNNKQRTEIYGLRRGILEGKEQREYVMEKARDILDFLVEDHLGNRRDRTEWDLPGFRKQLLHFFGYDPASDGIDLAGLELATAGGRIWEPLMTRYAAKEEKVGAEMMRHYERHILLQIIDAAWKDHLLAMDHLKDGIGLRAYGQRDPLVEYKRESFEMFSQMKERIENDAIRFLFLLEPMTEEERQAEEERLRREEERRRQQQEQIFAAASRSAAGVTARGGVQTVVHKTAKVGRNDPCPCGSGKKYKQCHGA
ncbi:MAG TPA: preprotein translocase subunit SecA [Candidatus Polarisedimenticolaceae bacterium]|nr:preprotein translocase subunit SecA [Candidatus Polarisedimenticolaceae bacterium]